MKFIHLIPLIIISFLLVACGAEAVPESSEPPVESTAAALPTAANAVEEALTEPATALPEETAVPAAEEAYPVPTVAPIVDEAYPADEPAQPNSVAPDKDEAYPAPTQPAPSDGDAELIWVQQPLGVQCEESASIEPTKGLQSAVEALAAAGVAAQQWETMEMIVMAVCGGPTSTHFRVEIPMSYLGTATSLGWVPE